MWSLRMWSGQHTILDLGPQVHGGCGLYVMLYPMVLYGTVSLFPSYTTNMGSRHHPSCINLPWSIEDLCQGPTFHIEDRPNNLGSTWGSSPNEPGHCRPWMPSLGKKTDAAMPSGPVWCGYWPCSLVPIVSARERVVSFMFSSYHLRYTVFWLVQSIVWVPFCPTKTVPLKVTFPLLFLNKQNRKSSWNCSWTVPESISGCEELLIHLKSQQTGMFLSIINHHSGDVVVKSLWIIQIDPNSMLFLEHPHCGLVTKCDKWPQYSMIERL